MYILFLESVYTLCKICKSAIQYSVFLYTRFGMSFCKFLCDYTIRRRTMENFVIIKDPNRGICNANIELILACNEAKKKRKKKCKIREKKIIDWFVRLFLYLSLSLTHIHTHTHFFSLKEACKFPNSETELDENHRNSPLHNSYLRNFAHAKKYYQRGIFCIVISLYIMNHVWQYLVTGVFTCTI